MLPPEWQTLRRILAVRLDNIGDVVMLSPALRTLREALPHASLTLLASPGGSLVAPLLPWVDDVIVWRAVWQDVSGDLPFDPQRELQLAADLREHSFDAAVIFTSFTQSPYPPAFIAYLAGIPIRLGHSYEFGGQVLSHWFRPPDKSGHQVDRNLSLLEAAGFPVRDRRMELHIPEATLAQADALLRAAGVEPLEPFVLLAPGASCTARRYDPHRFATAARRLRRETGLPVVIAGSQREAEKIAPVIQVAETERRVVSLVGKTGVPELAALIRRSSLVIANNSASLHFADAFQRPQVVLYSGTEYITQWEPRFSPARLLRREVECSPCFRFDCPYQMECLDIPPEAVVENAVELLAETTALPLAALREKVETQHFASPGPS